MDNVINRLVDIEDKAQKISSEAHDEELKLQQKIDEAVKKISSDIESKTSAQLREIRENETIYADKRVTEIKNMDKQQYADMEDEYSKNHDKWELDLFNTIIGR